MMQKSVNLHYQELSLKIYYASGAFRDKYIRKQRILQTIPRTVSIMRFCFMLIIVEMEQTLSKATCYKVCSCLLYNVLMELRNQFFNSSGFFLLRYFSIRVKAAHDDFFCITHSKIPVCRTLCIQYVLIAGDQHVL